MTTDLRYRRLYWKTLAALGVGAALVALCYFFIDRPFAFWVHENGIAKHVVLKWLTEPPPVLQDWAPAVLAALAVRRAWGPLRRWERTAAAAAIALVLADQCRESLAYVFGRTWPETWTHDN